MCLINGDTLVNILKEIYYLSEFINFPPQYTENLSIFEKDFYMHLALEKLKKEKESYGK